jgi:hypothetical protein
LAEGLYALLHIGSDLSTAPDRYWNEFLATRKRFLEEIIWRAQFVAPEIGQDIVRAVQTAMLCLVQLRPQAFEKYINAWRDDLTIWAERLDTVPRAGSLEEALETLALGSAQRGQPTIRRLAGTVSDLQEILDAATLAMHRIVPSLRDGRAGSMFARGRQWIEWTGPREAIKARPCASGGDRELTPVQDPVVVATPDRSPRQLLDVVGNS